MRADGESSVVDQAEVAPRIKYRSVISVHISKLYEHSVSLAILRSPKWQPEDEQVTQFRRWPLERLYVTQGITFTVIYAHIDAS